MLIALLMALPLLLFYYGLSFSEVSVVGGVVIFKTSVFLLRLWLEAIYVLNDINTSITANQLFNIREIKRTYPLISSGVLLADIISGFSLPIVLSLLPRSQGLPTVILFSFGMMVLGAGVLSYLSQTYQQSFPDRRRQERQSDASLSRVRGEMKGYVRLLIIFFGMAQVLLLLIDFQFLSLLEHQPGLAEGNKIASFLAVLNGTLGICELAGQWMFSSRVIERVGVFTTVMALPVVIVLLTIGIVICSVITQGWALLFWGLVTRKFLYELLHYTLFASVSPVLFQPIPEMLRGALQARVRGVAEPLATGGTGVALLLMVYAQKGTGVQVQNLTLFSIVIVLALFWLWTIRQLKKDYLNLLVFDAGRGKLSGSDIDLRELKRAVIESLEKPGAEADKRSCIELLSQIDPRNVGEVLSPLLDKLSPSLQQKSLEVMLNHPNPAYFK